MIIKRRGTNIRRILALVNIALFISLAIFFGTVLAQIDSAVCIPKDQYNGQINIPVCVPDDQDNSGDSVGGGGTPSALTLVDIKANGQDNLTVGANTNFVLSWVIYNIGSNHCSKIQDWSGTIAGPGHETRSVVRTQSFGISCYSPVGKLVAADSATVIVLGSGSDTTGESGEEGSNSIKPEFTPPYLYVTAPKEIVLSGDITITATTNDTDEDGKSIKKVTFSVGSGVSGVWKYKNDPSDTEFIQNNTSSINLTKPNLATDSDYQVIFTPLKSGAITINVTSYDDELQSASKTVDVIIVTANFTLSGYVKTYNFIGGKPTMVPITGKYPATVAYCKKTCVAKDGGKVIARTVTDGSGKYSLKVDKADITSSDVIKVSRTAIGWSHQLRQIGYKTVDIPATDEYKNNQNIPATSPMTQIELKDGETKVKPNSEPAFAKFTEAERWRKVDLSKPQIDRTVSAAQYELNEINSQIMKYYKNNQNKYDIAFAKLYNGKPSAWCVAFAWSVEGDLSFGYLKKTPPIGPIPTRVFYQSGSVVETFIGDKVRMQFISGSNVPGAMAIRDGHLGISETGSQTISGNWDQKIDRESSQYRGFGIPKYIK